METSTRTLADKLGISAGQRIYVKGAPRAYADLVQPLPPDVELVERLSRSVDLVHHFSRDRDELAEALTRYRQKIDPRTPVWVSWPKKASKLSTTVSEDVVRELALPLDFVDVKVCAVDKVWSGLKLVVRKSAR